MSPRLVYRLLGAASVSALFVVAVPGTALASPSGEGLANEHPTAANPILLSQNKHGGRRGLKKKRGGKGKMGGDVTDAQKNNPMHPSATREVQEKAGLFNTGVRAVYPKDATCLEVKSHFGDGTRYDGSTRVKWANHGYHGGSDISAPEGTPLVALADGEVVHKLSGGRLVGHQIMMRHTPDDTGLPVWIYSKYKHFREPPEVSVGDKVKMGDVVGLSGKTGTVGGHYGDAGYPHLHFSIFAAKTGEYKTLAKNILPRDVYYIDPIALYLLKDRNIFDNHAVRALSDDRKSVAIPYKLTNGNIVPANTKLIWPFMCAAK